MRTICSLKCFEEKIMTLSYLENPRGTIEMATRVFAAMQ